MRTQLIPFEEKPAGISRESLLSGAVVEGITEVKTALADSGRHYLFPCWK